MTQIVINVCHGGFGLSPRGFEHYLKLKGINYGTSPRLTQWTEDDKNYWRDGNVGNHSDYLHDRDIARDDQALIQTIKDLGKEADGFAARLKIVTIPDDVEWQIEEYDGLEWIAEKHRTWS